MVELSIGALLLVNQNILVESTEEDTSTPHNRKK